MQAMGYSLEDGDTITTLTAAAQEEMLEQQELYPAFAETARREGFQDAAKLWLQVTQIEEVHHSMMQALRERVRSGTLTAWERPIIWRCLNCGYSYKSSKAAEACPVCGKGTGWQEGKLDWRKLVAQK